MEGTTNLLINTGLIITYALFAVAMLVLVGFSIAQFFGNIKNSKATLFGIIALIVIFLIAYFTSSGSDIGSKVFEKVGTDYSFSKLIGSGLIMVYILFGATIAVLVGSEIARPFKK